MIRPVAAAPVLSVSFIIRVGDEASTLSPSAVTVPTTSRAVAGLLVPIPTELAEESTNKVPLSQFKSPVPPVSTVSVPTLQVLVR